LFADDSIVAEARAFIEDVEARLHELSQRASRALWVQQTYLTIETEQIAAEATRDVMAATLEAATGARRFDHVELPSDLARKLLLLKLAESLPGPPDPQGQAELAELAANLESAYGRAKVVRPGQSPLEIDDLERIMATSRDPAELLDAWTGWHAIGRPLRAGYTRLVELSNAGARTIGFDDLGHLWRSTYDLPADEFEAQLDRLWNDIRPLYQALHAYVRRRLTAHYGPEIVAPDGPLPAHLLGNVWAQEWQQVYPLVAPDGGTPTGSLTDRLQAAGYDAVRMMQTGEAFFTSLGFEPLPETFWERSMLTRPADREVVCHASAWCLDGDLDLRIKMCTQITAEDFHTVHHELGHIMYDRAYRGQPYLFRGGANDGFHEAIGDSVALSVTPEYLVRIGLLDRAPDASDDIGLLLARALEKVAFVPFALAVDRWRWGVFSGRIPPDQYNQAWWDLRLRYQGVAPPVPRGEDEFDAGAKYHIPAHVPYARYFVAAFLQYQFHRSLTAIAGAEGPLHRRSIHGSREAGRRLEAMLALGQSRPWPDALEVLTGGRQMDASGILDYYAPLHDWLDRQNRGQPVGWLGD
jgi:peptidyl-dipeptidase A